MQICVKGTYQRVPHEPRGGPDDRRPAPHQDRSRIADHTRRTLPYPGGRSKVRGVRRSCPAGLRRGARRLLWRTARRVSRTGRAGREAARAAIGRWRGTLTSPSDSVQAERNPSEASYAIPPASASPARPRAVEGSNAPDTVQPKSTRTRPWRRYNSSLAWGDDEDTLIFEGNPVELWVGLEGLPVVDPVVGVRPGGQALVEHDVADVVLLQQPLGALGGRVVHIPKHVPKRLWPRGGYVPGIPDPFRRE